MAYPSQAYVQESGLEGSYQPARAHSGQPFVYNALRSAALRQTPHVYPDMVSSPTKSPVSTGEMARPAPRAREQKQVTFELLLPVPQHRARLPMRVMISKHDNTDSIITTVKNFYGLYDGPGVSFQDSNGNILIAAYENLHNGMTVYVKVAEELVVPGPMDATAALQNSPKKPKLGPPFEMRPPVQNSRSSFNAGTRSPSPASMQSFQSANGKAKSRAHRQADGDSGEYSDSDGGHGSTASSRRSKAEPHASAEISVDNIVEGGRRKRAKFESSVSRTDEEI